jgi:peptide/nickel transport system substrate-binding protein
VKRPQRALAAIGLLAAGAIALSGCSGSQKTGTTSHSNGAYGGAINAVVNPSTKQGGTLKLAADADCDSWDPQRTYYGWCWNMQRLFTRSLVGFSKVNGAKPEVVGDLASGLGKHNANFTEWTYTLRPGLKFSTGKAITPQDVKYGVERMFATDVINGGPSSYYTSSIQHPKSYAGPYKSGDLSSIVTTSNSITFKLVSSFADFDYLMALPAAAPVPYKVEGGPSYKGANYTKKPVSSGPFVMTAYTPNKSVTFDRNKYWSKSTDPIRKPLAKSISLTINSSPADIDQKLKAGTYDAKMNIDIGSNLQTAVLTNSTLKKNADDAPTPFTRFFTVYQSVIPNVHCRRAIFYAVDKSAVLQAYGGPVHGTIAGSMTPITIPGHSLSADPYPSTKGKGDLAKAKQELQACGQPNGFSTKFAYSTPDEANPKVFQAVQASLAKIGIKVTATTNAASSYYTSFVGSPRNVKAQGIGISIYGWGSDFPTGYGFWQSIANGNAILQTGNSNQPSLNDPVVNKVLNDSLTGKSTDADFRKLDDKVMEDAVYLPIFFGKTLWYRNPRLTNITCDNALGFGAYDVVDVGVSQ